MSFMPLAALTLLTMQMGCSSNPAMHARTDDRVQSSDGMTQLEVASGNGSITVREDASAEGLAIKTEIRCFAPTAEEAEARSAAAMVVTERGMDGSIRVRVEFPEPKSSHDSANLDIRVAHAGALVLTSRNGHITVTEAGGAVSAETSNGAIQISLADGSLGDVSATTSNGAVQVALPALWQGTIEARTSNGRIELEADGALRKVGSGATTLVLGDAAAATVRIRTTNGAVSVRRRQ